jgi:hypothetical protein
MELVLNALIPKVQTCTVMLRPVLLTLIALLDHVSLEHVKCATIMLIMDKIFSVLTMLVQLMEIVFQVLVSLEHVNLVITTLIVQVECTVTHILALVIVIANLIHVRLEFVLLVITMQTQAQVNSVMEIPAQLITTVSQEPALMVNVISVMVSPVLSVMQQPVL